MGYRLLKKVEANSAVAPAGLYFVGAGPASVWFALGLFAVQYLATAIAARHNGVGLVGNVLALHGAVAKPTRRK